MTLLGFCAAAAGSWLILAALGTTSWCVLVTAYKRRTRRTRRIVGPYPPPVPLAQAVPSAAWFDGMPVEILSDDAVRCLLDELIEIEGLQ